MWRNLQRHEVIRSGGEVNCLLAGLPAMDFQPLTLRIVICPEARECPERHRRSFRAWQHGLRLYSALELLVQPLDCIGNRYKDGGADVRLRFS